MATQENVNYREELIRVLQNEDKYPNLKRECLWLHKLLKAILSVAVNPDLITKFKYQKDDFKAFKDELKDLDIRIKNDKCIVPRKLKEKELRKLIDFYYELLEPSQNKRKSVEKSEKAQSNQSKDLEKPAAEKSENKQPSQSKDLTKGDTKKPENKLPDKIEDPIKGDTKKPENKLPDKKEDPIYIDLGLDRMEDPNSSINPQNFSSIILAEAFGVGCTSIGPTSLEPGEDQNKNENVSNQEKLDSIGLDPNISIGGFIDAFGNFDESIRFGSKSLETVDKDTGNEEQNQNKNNQSSDNQTSIQDQTSLNADKLDPIKLNELIASVDGNGSSILSTREDTSIESYYSVETSIECGVGDPDIISTEDPNILDQQEFTCKECKEKNPGGFVCWHCNKTYEKRKAILKPYYDKLKEEMESIK